VNAKPKVLDLEAQVGPDQGSAKKAVVTDAGTQLDCNGKHNKCEGKERVASLCCQIVGFVEVWHKKEPAVSQNTLSTRCEV
jgi:hypothetical protein